MATWKRLLSLNVAMLAALSAPAVGQEVVYDVAPFRPHLTLDAAPDVCGPFLAEWQRTFDGPAETEAFDADLRAAFPDAVATTLGPQPGSLYNKVAFMPADFDGDGEDEVLHVESLDGGWRFLGLNFYLFENAAAHTAAFGDGVSNHLYRLPMGPHGETVPEEAYRHLARLPPANSVLILDHDGGYYVAERPTRETQPDALSVTLLRLDGESGAEPACTVELLPAVEALEPFAAASSLVVSLRDIYGGDGYDLRMGSCWRGTMGWTADPFEHPLYTALFRPQAMATRGKNDDVKRELALMSWALTDPQSWRDYAELKAARSGFLAEMAAYYRSSGAVDEQAREWAEQAWRYLVDSVVYNYNPFSGGLLTLARQGAPDLPITPDATPEEIARIAAEAWLAAEPELQASARQPNERIWSEVLLASIYAGAPVETAAIHWDRFEAAYRLEGVDNSYRRDELALARENVRAAALLAAFGDKALTGLALERGADPSAATNYFGKTPLMYAAQHDRLDAASRLLDEGADLGSTTEMTCGRLDRDHRTALMYAAENASAPLIDLLLDAGTDPSAVDTRGNPASWYFERNAVVADPVERDRIAERLAAPR